MTRLTDRELHALIALAEMRGMQLDVLAEFLGIGLKEAYRIARRLRSAGKVHPLVEVLAGPKWVVPTRAAATWALGWRPSDWRPSPMWAHHCRMVARTRVALGACGRQDWDSERMLRHHNAPGPRFYPYDGCLLRDDRCVAVKVDTSRHLTTHQLARRLRTAAHHARIDRCAELLYVCDGQTPPDTVRTTARHTLSDMPDLRFNALRFADLTRHPDLGQTGTLIDATTRFGR
ncbi:hypothetical protein [Nocardia wallacei]|uniref:Uncharacterized protein n=1 Tax=Nocardia wallacei TaxID=480035 RepID=A0A7G1KPC3_9NOCA|nr:hypothetical protein [Nocardia wallacei]BCK56681.1 hypothetical protein NWFMUON74_44530 [Nocardia wallacei]